MSGPLVFTHGDKDYIQKLNQMSQQSGDTQAAKHSAELAAATAQQAVQDARNAGAAEVAKAAAHAADAQAISETGLPSQAGNTGKFLKSNGTRTEWGRLTVAEIDGLQAVVDDLTFFAMAGISNAN